MASTFFTDLFTSLDSSKDALSSGMGSLMGVVMPAVESCFIVYLMFVIFSYWSQTAAVGSSMFDFMKRMVFIGLIISLGINISTYTSVVFPFITNLGNDLANAWGGASSGSSGSMLDGILNQISQITETNSMMAENASNPPDTNAGTGTTTPPIPATPAGTGVIGSVMGAVSEFTGSMASAMFGGVKNTIVAAIQNGIVWVVGSIFLVMAAAYLLIANTLLILLAAVGPIFFAFAIFPATRQFFNNWVGSVLNYGFLFLFIKILSAMFLKFVSDRLTSLGSGMVAGGGGMTVENLLIIICMFAVFTVIMIQLPNLASSLFGGLASNGFGAASPIGRAAKSAAGLSGKGAGAAGKAGWNAGKKGLNAWQNRGGNTMTPEADGK